MSRTAFLGLGAMGSRMAARLALLWLAGCTSDNAVPEPSAPTELTVVDGSATVELTGRDVEDAEFDLLVDVIALPTRGTLDRTSGSGGLRVTYTPEPGLYGYDALSFVVTDLDGAASAPFTVLLLVEDPEAAAPVPVADALVNVAEDGAVSFDLDGEDEGPVHITITGAPEHGLAGPSSGIAPLEVAYVPDADFHGFDSLLFTASDNDGYVSREAHVLVRVTPENDAPEAGDDAVSTDVSTPVVVDVLDNDVDIDGDLLVVSISTPPATGTAAVEVDGRIRYTPAAPGDHDVGYTVTDPDGLTDTATLTVTVASR